MVDVVDDDDVEEEEEEEEEEVDAEREVVDAVETPLLSLLLGRL